MSSPSTPGPASSAGSAKTFMKMLSANAKKNKQGFIQLFGMTGLLLLSVKSLGQKHMIDQLEEDTIALKEEHDSLTQRMDKIKTSLLHEASIEPSGVFASRLRLLFGGNES